MKILAAIKAVIGGAMAKIYYNKLLKQCFDGYTINDVPTRYQTAVRALADKDLEDGKLPRWQYNLMFPESEE